MRVVKKEVKIDNTKKVLYYEQFQDFNEYQKIVENRMKEKNCYKASFDKTWHGVDTYEEAKDLLLKGWNAKVEQLKTQIKNEIYELSNKSTKKMQAGPVGFMPIVPNAILGLPNSMLNINKDTKKQRIIKFLIYMNRSCGYSSSKIIDKMSKILARIANLERQGYRCRIETFGSFHSGEKNGKPVIVAHSILIKSESQLFDIKRVAFPMAHTAMQRVFGFSWERSLPLDDEDYHQYNLGCSMQYWRSNNRQAVLDAINENNEKIIDIGMESNLDEIFKNI